MDITVTRGRKVKCKTRFCEWLYREIEKSGMTMAQVGEQLGVSRTMISTLATGQHGPTLIQVLALCYVFESPDDPRWVWSLSKEEL